MTPCHNFVDMWMEVFDRSLEETERNLIRGDCYVFALATGKILEEQGHQVTYCDNGKHVYLKVDGLRYDGRYPAGVATGDALLVDGREMDFVTCWKENMLDDAVGGSFIQGFWQTYGFIYPPLEQLIQDTLEDSYGEQTREFIKTWNTRRNDGFDEDNPGAHNA